MRFRSLVAVSLALALLLGAVCGSQASPGADAAKNYQMVDLTACKKPRLAPPRVPKESYRRYNFQRRFLDLDGSGNCVLMDFWIERLGGSASVGMRTLEHRFLRPVGGKWQAFTTDLQYFPYGIKAHGDGKIYLIEAPVEQDIGDDMVLASDPTHVFAVAGWQPGGQYVAALTLQPEQARRAELLQALAALLEPRAGMAADKAGAEAARVRMLLAAAKNGTQ